MPYLFDGFTPENVRFIGLSGGFRHPSPDGCVRKPRRIRNNCDTATPNGFGLRPGPMPFRPFIQ